MFFHESSVRIFHVAGKLFQNFVCSINLLSETSMQCFFYAFQKKILHAWMQTCKFSLQIQQGSQFVTHFNAVRQKFCHKWLYPGLDCSNFAPKDWYTRPYFGYSQLGFIGLQKKKINQLPMQQSETNIGNFFGIHEIMKVSSYFLLVHVWKWTYSCETEAEH